MLLKNSFTVNSNQAIKHRKQEVGKLTPFGEFLPTKPQCNTIKTLSLFLGTLNMIYYLAFLSSKTLCPCVCMLWLHFLWTLKQGWALCGPCLESTQGYLLQCPTCIHFHCYLGIIHLNTWHALKYELHLSYASLYIILPKSRSKITDFKVYLRFREGNRLDSLRPYCITKHTSVSQTGQLLPTVLHCVMSRMPSLLLHSEDWNL